MLKERNIPEEWVLQAIQEAEWQKIGTDKNVHYSKGIREYDGRILHVIVNPHVLPQKVVSVFFDRRVKSRK